MTLLDDAAATLRERIPEAVDGVRTELGWDVIEVAPPAVADAIAALRESGWNMLTDLSVTDWLPREPRFHINYHLYSFGYNARLRVKARVGGDEPRLPSITPVHPGANFQEREAWDMFGIIFEGHPNLVRILMPDEWIGHPQRKDYPTGGVPVEYKIEPAYIGPEEVSRKGRPAAAGVPPRLARDRGQKSKWTWTGAPASGVRKEAEPAAAPDGPEPSGEVKS